MSCTDEGGPSQDKPDAQSLRDSILKRTPSTHHVSDSDYQLIAARYSRTSIIWLGNLGMFLDANAQLTSVTMDTVMFVFCACADAHVH